MHLEKELTFQRFLQSALSTHQFSSSPQAGSNSSQICFPIKCILMALLLIDIKHMQGFVVSPVSESTLLKCSESTGANFRSEPGGRGMSRVTGCLLASTADSQMCHCTACRAGDCGNNSEGNTFIELSYSFPLHTSR